MARAKCKIATKITGVTLELDREEALAIVALGGKISGTHYVRKMLTGDGGSFGIYGSLCEALGLPTVYGARAHTRAQEELGIELRGDGFTVVGVK